MIRANSFKCWRSKVLFIGLVGLLAAGLSFVAKNGPPDGVGDEATGNNLSVPVIFTGDAMALRGTEASFSLGGAYVDGYVDPVSGLPVIGTPPEGAQQYRIFLQKDALNTWQAGNNTGALSVDVDYADWGDNLESMTWTTSSIIRVELVPYFVLADHAYIDSEGNPTTLWPAFEMWYVSGSGKDEMWGAAFAVTEDGEGNVYYSPHPFTPGLGTIHTSSAKLSIQKLEAGEGDQASPPTTVLTWDPLDSVWYNADETATYQPFALDGFPTAFTPELNIGGKVMYGHVWFMNRLAEEDLPAGITKAGWYRLTFSTTDDAILFTALTESALPTETATTSEESDSGPLFSPVIDVVNNLTYIDIYIRGGQGNGGGRGGGGQGNGGH